MQNNLFRFLCCAFILISTVTSAKVVLQGTSLIQMNTRIFDMGIDVARIPRTEHFIPLNRVRWIDKILASDEFLRNIVVHIRVNPQPFSDTAPPNGHWARGYTYEDNIPDFFDIDGFKATSNHPSNASILLIPDTAPLDFSITCAADQIDVYVSCFVRASYHADPNILLLARVYGAREKRHQFYEIVQRMREIVSCLDVTDRLLPDGSSPNAIVDPKGELPSLTNCNELIS